MSPPILPSARAECPVGDRWREPRPGRAAWLGRLGWDEALALQERLHADRVAGRAPDTLLLLEHDSVYTAGRGADPRHFLVPPAELERDGHLVREAGRGGDVTWHGPGQLVAYPVIDLGDGRRDVHRYLRLLEEVLIRTCADHGVAAARRDGLTGAWTAGGKVAAIGVRVARWVTQHGTSLNVAPDLAALRAIVPCGLADEAVTSLQRETGHAPSVRAVAATYARRFGEVFATTWDLPLSDLPGAEPALPHEEPCRVR